MYGVTLGPARFLWEKSAKHDSPMVTVRQYDGDNTTVRLQSTTVRCWQYDSKMAMHDSHHRTVVFVLSYFHHRTATHHHLTDVLPYCHIRTVVLSPLYCRIVTIFLRENALGHMEQRILYTSDQQKTIHRLQTHKSSYLNIRSYFSCVRVVYKN
jgi:hypothetical protein